MKTITALIISLIICAPAYAGSRLPASHFKVISVNAEWAPVGWLQVVAEIKNVGKTPGLPLLQITGRDKNGTLLDSGDYAPMISGQVQPGDTCAIKYPLTRNKAVESVNVKVVGGMVRD